MYQKIYNFLDRYFPSIEGCILFGSYIDKGEEANDIDLLLISNNFSFSSTESFVFNECPFNTIKINSSEILNIIAKQFKQGNFLAHAFKTGVVIKDETREVIHIKKYVIGDVPNAAADIISFDLHEVRFKIKDYLEPIKKAKALTPENFLQASRVISLLVDFFLLNNGVYLKTEKSKNKYFFQNFPNEAFGLSTVIDALKKSNITDFENRITDLILKYSIFTDKKYSNNFILDDYTQDVLICFVENTFKFNKIIDIIDKIKENNSKVKFFIYQVDEENQEKEGCYIVLYNMDRSIDLAKNNWIQFFQNIFDDHNYIFPYNNIFCHPEIKFMGKPNQLIFNDIMLSLIDSITEKKHLSKEEIIFNILTDFFASSTMNVDYLYNFYLIKMDGKAKISNYLNNNSQKIEKKFVLANQSIEGVLLQRFVLKDEKLIDFRPLLKISPLVHLQILDRILSIFLSKDYEKLYYIYAIKLKLNEKVS